MYKQALFGKEARDKILSGIKKISDAVSVTLGPNGRHVFISNAEVINYGTYTMPNICTKDGVTVAKAFDVTDAFEKVGVMAVKEAAEKTVLQAGDGTTGTTVLLRAIAEGGMALIEKGVSPVALKKGIDKAVDYITTELKNIAIPVKGDLQKIRQIATVSANNDEGIGGMIADAFHTIGEEGIIDLEASNSVKTELKLADGLKIEKGWVHPLFANNREKQLCEFENPLILLYEKRINHHTQVEAALQVSIKEGRPLLIICEEAEQEGLSFLAMNVTQGRVRACIVSAPEFGEARRLAMEDIALVTGGTYLSDTKGKSIKQVTKAELGSAKKVVVSREETIIIGGGGAREAVQKQLDELRTQLALNEKEEERLPVEKRIAKLTGGVAVIQVGGTTETEMKERLDRFDDAVRAVKSAIAEGFCAGGGTVFLKLRKQGVAVDVTALRESGATVDEVIERYAKTGSIVWKGPDVPIQEGEFHGYDLVFNALKQPFAKICSNSGIDADVIYEKLSKNGNNKVGYNAKTDTIENLIDAGIIDPIKVLRCSLQNAASVAGMVLTADCVIVDSVNG